MTTATATSALNSLKFVTAAQPAAAASAVSPTDRRRHALISRIEEQIALATAQLEGKKFEPTRQKTVTDKTTGEKTKQTVVKKVRQLWWQVNKSFFVQIRYGASLLTFKGGTNSVETNSLKGVVTVLTTIKTAVAAGELDQAIEAVTSKRGKKAAK